MVANVQLCQELGYITAPKGMIRQLSAEAETLPDERVLVLCTGSQGEEFSALVRMSKSDFKDFTLKPEDGIRFGYSYFWTRISRRSKTHDVALKSRFLLSYSWRTIHETCKQESCNDDGNPRASCAFAR